MIIVIADDITGAAEIAGIALNHGLKTSFAINDIELGDALPDVFVVATNTRSETEDSAAQTITALCRKINNVVCDFDNVTIFKKTDSVLRGHISTELVPLMKELCFHSCLLIPQNPSKGRIIRGGVYYINGKPLSETSFSYDPEYPANSSVVIDLIGNQCKNLRLTDEIEEGSNMIYVADAANPEELSTQVSKQRGDILMAGAADFFTALLYREFHIIGKSHADKGNDTATHEGQKIVIMCGSTQSKPIEHLKYLGCISDNSIPNEIFHGCDHRGWIEELVCKYKQSDTFIMKVGNHEMKGVEYAIRIKSIMADAAKALVAESMPNYLIIEGGATAYAILEELRWKTFTVTREFSSGVVGLRHGNTEIILKPGSYSWGNLFNLL